MTNNFPIEDIKDKINTTNGPMLLTSKNKKSSNLWNYWLNKNPDSNSYVLIPKEAYVIQY